MPRRPWSDLVAAGRRAVTTHNWKLGDLALEVETSYGGSELHRYALDVGVDTNSLRVYRYVAVQWPRDNRLTRVSWTVHMVLAAQDDRFELIETVTTVAAARELVRTRKEEADQSTDTTVGPTDTVVDPGDDADLDDDEPSFEPTDDQQPDLSRRKPLLCPNCGTEVPR